MNMYGNFYPQSMPQAYRQQPYFQPVNGRYVTSEEEARVAQIPLDGTLCYFPSPVEKKVYVKFVDNNGMAVFDVYERVVRPPAPAYAEVGMVQSLANRLEQIESYLTGGKGNADESVSVNADATMSGKSRSNDGADVGK